MPNNANQFRHTSNPNQSRGRGGFRGPFQPYVTYLLQRANRLQDYKTDARNLKTLSHQKINKTSEEVIIIKINKCNKAKIITSIVVPTIINVILSNQTIKEIIIFKANQEITLHLRLQFIINLINIPNLQVSLLKEVITILEGIILEGDLPLIQVEVGQGKINLEEEVDSIGLIRIKL